MGSDAGLRYVTIRGGERRPLRAGDDLGGRQVAELAVRHLYLDNRHDVWAQSLENISLQSLYGLAFQYADKTLNRGAYTGARMRAAIRILSTRMFKAF